MGFPSNHVTGHQTSVLTVIHKLWHSFIPALCSDRAKDLFESLLHQSFINLPWSVRTFISNVGIDSLTSIN